MMLLAGGNCITDLFSFSRCSQRQEMNKQICCLHVQNTLEFKCYH